MPALVARAHGVVLELGPGTGNQFERFDAAKLTHVYGVEPNTAFAGAMAERLAATPGGLRDKYTPIFCGVEDSAELAKHGIVPGSLDCVVSMQVLCSVSKPREVARQLYDLLKPGGEMLFWEHQRNEDWLGWAVQCKRWLSFQPHNYRATELADSLDRVLELGLAHCRWWLHPRQAHQGHPAQCRSMGGRRGPDRPRPDADPPPRLGQADQAE